MPKTLETLETLPAAQAAPGLILHIGAGDGDAITAHLASSAARIVLVEPNPDRVADLERRSQTEPRLEVLPVALAAQDGQAELLVFNFTGLSSLHAPTGLSDLLPGLRIVARPVVRTLSVSGLLDRLGPKTGKLQLVLEAPGAEQDILLAWKAAGALGQIDLLDLRCGAEPLFAGAAPMAVLQSWLEAEGFDAATADLTDPDWPMLRFRLNPAVQEATALRKTQVTLQAQVSGQAAALKDAAGTLAARDGRIKDQDAALSAERAKAQAAEAQASGQAAALKDAADTLAARDGRIKDQDAALNAERAKAQAAEAQATATATEKDTRTRLVSQQKSQIDTLEQRVKELEHKQTLARNELRRAEGQIDLIKDLLLREGGL